MSVGDEALRTAKAARRSRNDDDVLNGGFHLIDGGEIGERPGAELMRRDRSPGVLLGHFGIFGVAREIEQADRKTLIIDAIENGRKAECVGANAIVRSDAP